MGLYTAAGDDLEGGSDDSGIVKGFRRIRRLYSITLMVLVVVVLGLVGRIGWNVAFPPISAREPLWNLQKNFLGNDTRAESSASETMSSLSVPSLRKTNPSFHLLVPATKTSPDFCRLLLSSFLLGYPTPTLLLWNHTYEDDEWGVKAHIAKIQGAFDFLNNTKNVADNDLVLMVDGYDVFFQLPPDVLIKNYATLLSNANSRILDRYGMSGGNVSSQTPRFKQSIVFAADKICWPNAATSLACAKVPQSSLPDDAYGPDTDRDTTAFLNRPRFLNSGALIGPAADVRDMFNAALRKIESDTSGAWSDQYILASVWGEQEYARESTIDRSKIGKKMSAWRKALSRAGIVTPHKVQNDSTAEFEIDPEHRYEYGIGIDYENVLFQTMTHGAKQEVEYITYTNRTQINKLRRIRSHMLRKPKPELTISKPPFAIHSNSSLIPSNGNKVNYADYPSAPSIYPPKSGLDALPPLNTSWNEIPLASNLYTSSIPCLLHLNGDFKGLIKDYWRRMWFFPYSRALLRQYMRKSMGEDSVRASIWGGENWWDERGGRGGAWTDNADWMDWAEMCAAGGWEDEIFDDGKGGWGAEDVKASLKGGEMWNDWNRLLTG